MKYFAKRIFKCIAALCLICVLLTPNVVFAAVRPPVEPQASDYLSTYHGYVSKSGNTIQPVFSVSGTGRMEDIGATEIYLYESSDGVNYSMVKSYRHANYSNMLAHNTSAHASYMSYSGNANYTYKAYICVFAGRNGGGDARYFWAYEI